MFKTMFNNWDDTKTFKTVETLEKALAKYDDALAAHAVLVMVPHGKNVGRYTVIIPSCNGHNIHWAHRGFKVMG